MGGGHFRTLGAPRRALRIAGFPPAHMRIFHNMSYANGHGVDGTAPGNSAGGQSLTCAGPAAAPTHEDPFDEQSQSL